MPFLKFFTAPFKVKDPSASPRDHPGASRHPSTEGNRSDHPRRLKRRRPLYGRGILAVKDLDHILLCGGVAGRDLRPDEVIYPK